MMDELPHTPKDAVAHAVQSPRRIHVLDTSVASGNLGDEFIVQSLLPFLREHFADAYISTSASHDGLGKTSRKLAANADLVFVLGTNLLGPSWRGYGKSNFPLQEADIKALAGKVVLFGVGAVRSFDGEVKVKQASVLRTLLHPGYTHEVRDASARHIVSSLGLDVFDGHCPTLWSLAEQYDFAPRAQDHVCFALTYYRADREADTAFLRWLEGHYDRLTFWAQQYEDIAYLESLKPAKPVHVLGPQLENYRAFLAANDVDVIGSRLHGGICSLKYGRRTVILAVDNRATELAQSTSLPILDRATAVEKLDAYLDAPIRIDLSVMKAHAERFLSQFPKGEAILPPATDPQTPIRPI